ncbi:flagellin N-terminal helical domain-containing protein [Paenibacillus sp. Soil522]|uniref:flagellin N-terminal helical domain-containing protein n=1 Tax=Paenibacillus sp. Soil522 TaxID=1736388 RepID=UPI000701A60E|nr:flagellin [Paenibacillus sp. Soil522]KRE44481.1 flagellin [Paenibacillus sp. Soil522]
MRINHNIAALNTHRQLSTNTANQSKSIEKLSSGLRINRAGDDAAGLAISEKMRGQIRGLEQATRNAQDGISLIQTAEGALNETHSILQRMNELATQGANGTLSATDRTAIGDEITQLNSEIDRISTSTKFNGQTLLAGTFGSQLDTTASGIGVGNAGVTAIDISGATASTTYTIAVGAVGGAGTVMLDDGNGNVQEVALADNTAGVLDFDKLGVKISVNSTWDIATLAAASVGTGTGTIDTTASAAVNIQIGSENAAAQKLGISISKIDATSLSTAGVDVSSSATAATAMTTIQNAIDVVSAQRSKLGAYQNRLDHTINNISTASENLTAAESRVRDVDMAKEMMEQTKNSILAQASQAMLAQANQQPQGVLQLLR